ncbi:MAG: FAD-dependent oxidoreductase, partial [Syntrophales bacterium]|nr:FAD-dependent oxidoreductase [Syntrophales bacterium]
MASPYDVVIVGGGPAGYTAGLYAARGGLRTLLFTGTATVSQITVTDFIENYPGIPEGIGGFELVERFRQHAVNFGLQTEGADVSALARIAGPQGDCWRVTAGGEEYDALAVIIATGAAWRKLGVPGEETFAGRGVSYCATCDGALFEGVPIAVVGGGDSATQESLFLTRFASKVYLLHRRDQLL